MHLYALRSGDDDYLKIYDDYLKISSDYEIKVTKTINNT